MDGKHYTQQYVRGIAHHRHSYSSWTGISRLNITLMVDWRHDKRSVMFAMEPQTFLNQYYMRLMGALWKVRFQVSWKYILWNANHISTSYSCNTNNIPETSKTSESSNIFITNGEQRYCNLWQLSIMMDRQGVVDQFPGKARGCLLLGMTGVCPISC